MQSLAELPGDEAEEQGRVCSLLWASSAWRPERCRERLACLREVRGTRGRWLLGQSFTYLKFKNCGFILTRIFHSSALRTYHVLVVVSTPPLRRWLCLLLSKPLPAPGLSLVLSPAGPWVPFSDSLYQLSPKHHLFSPPHQCLPLPREGLPTVVPRGHHVEAALVCPWD